MSGYFTASTMVGVAFNIALLRYAQRQRKNLSRQQAIDSNLPKTIVMIIPLMIVVYLPLTISFNITAFEFVNSTDKSFTQKRPNMRLAAIPCQVNAVLKIHSSI